MTGADHDATVRAGSRLCDTVALVGDGAVSVSQVFEASPGSLQAVALAGIAAADTFTGWATVAVLLLGVGTAMVYPTLLAAVGDVAHPAWRARAVGVYRLWHDGGFASGALLADAYGILGWGHPTC